MNQEWDNTFGGSDIELFMTDIELAHDGGYIVVSASKSFNLDNLFDIYVFTVDSLGVLGWDETYGAGSEEILSVSMAHGINNDGYIIGGYTASDTSTLIKIDEAGDLQWKRNNIGVANCVQNATFSGNDGYIIAGTIDDSEDGKNVLLILTDENGNAPDAPDRPE